MRPRLLQWLVCPLCHHELTLVDAVSERRPLAEADYHVLEATAPIEDPNDVESNIISGALACDACRIYYSDLQWHPEDADLPNTGGITACVGASRLADHSSGRLWPSSEDSSTRRTRSAAQFLN